MEMTVAYHLWLDEAAKGPLTINQLRAMWNSGQLTGENLFSMNGGQEWHYLSDIVSELEPFPIALIPLNPSKNQTPAPFPVEEVESNSTYQKRLAEFLNNGWTVVSEGSTGAQLQGPKVMLPVTKFCLVLGVILLLFYGSGLILIICALIGHANQKPKTEFISRNSSNLIKSQIATAEEMEKRTTAPKVILGIVIFVTLVFTILGLVALSH